MPYKISNVDVWAGEMPDQPGSLARVLDGLARAGADIAFLIARREADKPATSVVFLTPIRGVKQTKAAQEAGLSKAASLGSLRIEGPNRKGLGARIASAIGQAGINIRGTSASAIGNRSVAYFSFDNAEDAKKAAPAVRKALAGKW